MLLCLCLIVLDLNTGYYNSDYERERGNSNLNCIHTD